MLSHGLFSHGLWIQPKGPWFLKDAKPKANYIVQSISNIFLLYLLTILIADLVASWLVFTNLSNLSHFIIVIHLASAQIKATICHLGGAGNVVTELLKYCVKCLHVQGEMDSELGTHELQLDGYSTKPYLWFHYSHRNSFLTAWRTNPINREIKGLKNPHPESQVHKAVDFHLSVLKFGKIPSF